MTKTLGQIAHDAGKFDRQWHRMGESQKADWERIAQAVIDAQQVAVPVPMTDVEIYVVARNHPRIATLVPHIEVGHFARAIEQHHGIGAKP